MPLRILFSSTPAQIAALPSADEVAARLEAALTETRPAARSRAPLSERIRALIDAPEFATMATLAPDGRPRQSMVWAKTDGADVLVSTTTDRLKYHDLLRDPRISLLASPKDHPYIYTATPLHRHRGHRVQSSTTECGPELIQEPSRRYSGGPYTFCTFDGPDTVRIVARITPTKAVYSNPQSRRSGGTHHA